MGRIIQRHRRRGREQEPQQQQQQQQQEEEQQQQQEPYQQYQTRVDRLPTIGLQHLLQYQSPMPVMPPPVTSVGRMGPAAGECRPGQCGPEAACMKFPNNTHICVCPHDSSPPTIDLKCPNRLTVPLTPQPIHNIIPPSGGNLTTVPGNTTTQQTADGIRTRWEKGEMQLDVTMVAIGAFALLTILILAIVCWWKRKYMCHDVKSRRSSCSTSPMNLKKSLLVADRYTPNPQYSVCTSPLVPLLARDMLRFHQEIGEGCFGKVYKGELTRDAPTVGETSPVEIVAIKVLKESASPEAEEDFMREVDIMSAFRHKNILSLIGVVLREAGQSPWMVFEFMPHGDLAEVLRSNSRSPLWTPQPHAGLPTELTRTHLLSAAQQIASGMRYLAAQRFVHRDLACRNCLVGTGLTVKIADFGMSRDVYTCDYYKIGGSRLLPVRWMSPESVMYGRFTLESDVWSYGVVLWEIYSLGKQPYYGHNNEEVLKLILQGIMLIPPEDCPSEICDLMRCCWKTEPRDRIRFPEIFERLEKAAAQSSANKLDGHLSTPLHWNNNDVKKTRSTNSLQRDAAAAGVAVPHNVLRSNSTNTLQNQCSERQFGGGSTFDRKSAAGKANLINSFLIGCESGHISLPRPPPIPVTPNLEMLDREGYLLPQPNNLTCEYMETLPD